MRQKISIATRRLPASISLADLTRQDRRNRGPVYAAFVMQALAHMAARLPTDGGLRFRRCAAS